MNGSGRRITVHEAQLKTVQVEVKALTITGKQVTLAVFRQLQEEELVDPVSLKLAGIPWGTVNYHWGACHAGGAHWHVVWQKAEELRRSQVNRERPWQVTEHFGKLIDYRYEAYLLHLALEGQLTREKNSGGGWKFCHQIAGKELRKSLWSDPSDDVWKCATELPYKREPPDGREHYRGLSDEDFEKQFRRHEEWQDRREQEANQKKEQALTKLREHLAAAKDNARDSAEARKILEKAIRDSEQHARNWIQTYDSLACLDQLFIAV